MTKSFYPKSKWVLLAACMFANNIFLSAQTYTTIGLTGFNADVIANGTGNASALSTADVDGGGFAYVSGDYKATSTSSAPTYSLPSSGSFISAATAGLPFQMASFSAANALRLTAGSSGTLTFLNPTRAQTVYPLVIGGGGAVSGITFTVTFDDASTQVFTGQSAPDWYSSATNARSGVGRVSRVTNGLEGSATTPRLFQLSLAIDPANQGKKIVSIGASTTSGGILNIFAISVRTPSGLSCDVPTAISGSNITLTGATLTWTANGTPDSYQYVYGPYGATGFDPASATVQNAATATATLGSLNPGTLYQVYVRQVCSGTPGSWAGPYNFTTLAAPCNAAPVAGTVTGISSAYAGDNVSLALNGNTDINSVTGITVQWQKSATGQPGSWSNIATGATSIMNSLTATSYFRAYLYCSNTGQSDTTPGKLIAAYCKPTYSISSASYRIGNVTYGTINNTTTGNTTTDFTSLSNTVTAGVPVPMTVTTYGFLGFAVAVDFNGDGDFADTDEIIFPGFYNANNPATSTVNITIPGYILTGSYRMRVYNWGGNSAGTAQPCGAAGTGTTYGTFRDYTVNVTNSATCFPPSGLTVSNILPHSADAVWTASTTSPTGYEWKVMLGAANPDIDPAVVSSTVSSAVTSASISALAGSTTYSLYVRSQCGASNSVWTNAATFTTPLSCAPPISLTSSGVTSTAATISWAAPATTSPGSYDLYYSTVNTAPTASTTLTASNSYTGITGLSQPLTGLIHNTTYYVWVRSNCGVAEGLSTWAAVASFTTPISCYPVTALDITDITGTNVTFGWSAPAQGNPVVNYQYELRTSGTAGSGATGLAQGGFSTTTSLVLSGLSTGTAYTFYVRTDCNASDSSSWVSKAYTVPTYVPITITSYNQDVIAEGVATSVSTTTTAVDDPGTNGTGGYAYLSSTFRNPASPNTPPAYSLPANGRILNGVKYFQLAPYNQVNSTRLAAANAFDTMKFFTPRSAKTVNILSVSGSGSSLVRFRVLYSDNTSATFDSLTVADWYGGSPVVLASVGRVSRSNDAVSGASNGPNLYETVLTLASGDTTKTIKGIVVTKINTSGYLNVFGVSILPSAAACQVPTALSVNGVTASAANFSWNGTAANYQISYATQGTTADNGTFLPLQSSTTYAFSTLNAGTPYSVYVRSICGSNPGDTSFWAGPVNFTTQLTPCSGAPAPGATLATVSDICISGNTTLSLTNSYSTNSGITYQWQSSSDGISWNNIATAASQTYTTPTITATTRYRCRVICNAGPDTGYSAAKVITVHGLPLITVTPQQAVFCASGNATLTAGGGVSYTWSPVQDLNTATGSVVVASPVSTTTYTVTGTDIYGCVNTATATVGLIGNITPQASGQDICAVNTAANITVTPIVSASGPVEYELTDTTGNVVASWQSANVFNITAAAAGWNKYLVFARSTACPADLSDTGKVQLYAGFGADVIVNNATCPNGDGSIVVSDPQGPGISNVQTWYANDFSLATLNAVQATLSGNALITGGRGVVTPSATSNKGGLTILNPAAITTNALNVTFDLTADQPINTYGTGGADGISYSFGDDADYSTSITNGAGSKLRVVFDAANNSAENNNHAGIYVTYGYNSNTQMGDASAGVLAHSVNTDWKTQTDKPVSINITESGKLTLTWNGTVIFSDVQLPAAYLSANKSTWKHLFNAFTGGDALRFAIDNLDIKYGAESFSYGRTAANAVMPPSTWQSSNVFSNLSGGDSLDIWIANPSNPAGCNQKLGTYTLTAPVMAGLFDNGDPSCIGADDGYVALSVNTPGTYTATYTKNGGAPYTTPAIASGNDGTTEYVLVPLPQGIYTNMKLTSSGGCASNNISGPVALNAPAATTIAPGTATAATAAQPGAGTQYYTDASCNLIASVNSPNNLGNVTASVTVGSSALISPSNNEPFIGRYYEITPTQNGNLPAQIKLYFSVADFNAYNASPSVGTTYPALLSDGSNLRITAFHGLPSSGTSGPNGSYNAGNADLLQPLSVVWNNPGGWWEVTVNSPNGFSGFFANTNTNAPLIINLGQIAAVNDGSRNLVKWDTRSESTGDYFNVERSRDGRSFSKIGSQPAKGAAPSAYVFTDEQPYPGLNHYRLQMVNADGSGQYSKVVTAMVNSSNFSFNVYPNPASNQLTVKVTAVVGKAVAELADITGRVILRREVDASGSVSLPVDQLSNGIYLVKYHDDAHNETIKVNKN